MAGGLHLDYSDFTKAAAKLQTLPAEINKAVDQALNAGADSISGKAKELAPVDMGFLRAHIAPDKAKFLNKEITVNAPYAAFVEFGTGRYAAAYVATLPDNWQAYARQFKGQKGGTLDEMLAALIDWVKRKGLIGLTKGGSRRSGKKADSDAYNLAYVVAIRILQNGIKPQKFLYMAFIEGEGQIKKDIAAVINNTLNGK